MFVIGCFGNSYDNRVWKRESMEGALLASVVAGKMLSKMKKKKFKYVHGEKYGTTQ